MTLGLWADQNSSVTSAPFLLCLLVLSVSVLFPSVGVVVRVVSVPMTMTLLMMMMIVMLAAAVEAKVVAVVVKVVVVAAEPVVKVAAA